MLRWEPNFDAECALDQGWGFDYKGDERTVDTHIGRLREKIGEHSIKTLADRDAICIGKIPSRPDRPSFRMAGSAFDSIWLPLPPWEIVRNGRFLDRQIS